MNTGTGPRGLGLSSFLVRRVTLAYSLVWLGVVLGFIVSGYLYAEARAKIRDEAKASVARVEAHAQATCRAGNDRSQLQLEDLRDERQRLLTSDLTRLLGLTADQAAELRRLTLETNALRMSRIPFVNCATGERLPNPPPP